MSDYLECYTEYSMETRSAKRSKVRVHITNAHQYARRPWREAPAWKKIIAAPAVDEQTQIKHSWNPDDKSPRIACSPDDPLQVCRLSALSSTDCIRGRQGYSTGVHVWHVQWHPSMPGSHAAIGVGTKEAPLTSRRRESLVGWTDTTWGWDLVQQKVHHDKQTFPDGGCTYPLLSHYDEIPKSFHMVLDMKDGTLSFLVAGKHLGVAFSGLKGRTVYPMMSCVHVPSRVRLTYLGSARPHAPSLASLARGAFKRAEYRNLGRAMRSTLLPVEVKEFVLQMPSPFPEVATLEEVQKKAAALTNEELDQLNVLRR